MSVQLWRRPGLVLLLTLWIMLSTALPTDAAGAGQMKPDAAQLDDVPIWLSIPHIDLETSIVPAGWHEENGRRVWDVPADAAGWHLGSGHVGERSNLMLSGHNNTGGSVFRNLGELAVGDTVSIGTQVGARRYTVTNRVILRVALQSVEQRLANARWIGDFPDERITLITCYPAWSNTHRLVLVAKPDGDFTPSHTWRHGPSEE